MLKRTTKNKAGNAAKKPKITYVAKYNGVIVGRVNSAVPYTHAVIVQRDEEMERHEAYDTEPTKMDRHWFDLDVYRAEAPVGARIAPGPPERGRRGASDYLTAEWIAKAKEVVAAGFDAFVARSRESRIKEFEEGRREGAFEPYVGKWLKPGDDVAATKEWLQYLSPKVCEVTLAESEESVSVGKLFSKLPKSAQRELLADVCNKMIERKAWDEIATFLVSQLGAEDAPTILKLVRK